MHFELEDEAFEFFGQQLERESTVKPVTLDSAKHEVDLRGSAWRKWLQKSLTGQGFPKLGTDGKLGGPEVQALADFQKKLPQVTPTGLVDAPTIAALEQASGTKAPAWFLEKKGYQKAIAVPHGGVKRGDSRCTGDGFSVPQLDDVIATNGVSGIPFEYVGNSDPRVRAGLKFFAPQDRTVIRSQSFVEDVKRRLELFVSLLRSAGLEVEAILTAGSLVQRCMTGTNIESNHSRAAAFDLVGVRWAGKARGALRETIVHNYKDPGERKLLMRLNAALRLSFPNVLDYNYNSKHFDHFHCDLNGASSSKRSSPTHIKWLRDALTTVTSGSLWIPSGPKAVSGRLDAPLYQLMRAYLLLPKASQSELNKQLSSTYSMISAKIASGGV